VADIQASIKNHEVDLVSKTDKERKYTKEAKPRYRNFVNLGLLSLIPTFDFCFSRAMFAVSWFEVSNSLTVWGWLFIFDRQASAGLLSTSLRM
jgi:hypothetical protein